MGFKVQDKNKFKLPLDMASKHVLLHLQLPDFCVVLHVKYRFHIRDILAPSDTFPVISRSGCNYMDLSGFRQQTKNSHFTTLQEARMYLLDI